MSCRKIRPYGAGQGHGLWLHPSGPVFELRKLPPPWQIRLSAASAWTRGASDRAGRRYCCASRPIWPKTALETAVEGAVAFTSPGAQKPLAQNGSRTTAPRYSVGAEPEVRRLLPTSRCRSDVNGATSCNLPRPPNSRRFPNQMPRPRAELQRHAARIVTPREALAQVQPRAEQIYTLVTLGRTP